METLDNDITESADAKEGLNILQQDKMGELDGSELQNQTNVTDSSSPNNSTQSSSPSAVSAHTENGTAEDAPATEQAIPELENQNSAEAAPSIESHISDEIPGPDLSETSGEFQNLTSSQPEAGTREDDEEVTEADQIPDGQADTLDAEQSLEALEEGQTQEADEAEALSDNEAQSTPTTQLDSTPDVELPSVADDHAESQATENDPLEPSSDATLEESQSLAEDSQVLPQTPDSDSKVDPSSALPEVDPSDTKDSNESSAAVAAHQHSGELGPSTLREEEAAQQEKDTLAGDVQKATEDILARTADPSGGSQQQDAYPSDFGASQASTQVHSCSDSPWACPVHEKHTFTQPLY